MTLYATKTRGTAVRVRYCVCCSLEACFVDDKLKTFNDNNEMEREVVTDSNNNLLLFCFRV